MGDSRQITAAAVRATSTASSTQADSRQQTVDSTRLAANNPSWLVWHRLQTGGVPIVALTLVSPEANRVPMLLWIYCKLSASCAIRLYLVLGAVLLEAEG